MVRGGADSFTVGAQSDGLVGATTGVRDPRQTHRTGHSIDDVGSSKARFSHCFEVAHYVFFFLRPEDSLNISQVITSPGFSFAMAVFRRVSKVVREMPRRSAAALPVMVSPEIIKGLGCVGRRAA